MKLIKMFGLTMVAAVAAMAFAGAGTASASEICKAAEHPCSEANLWPDGRKEGTTPTKVKAATASGAKAHLKDVTIFGTKEEECDSTAEGEITRNPGETKENVQGQAKGMITKVTFTNCQPTCTATAIPVVPTMEVRWRVHINFSSSANDPQGGEMWIGPETREKENGTWLNAPGAKLEPCTEGSGCSFRAHETQPPDYVGTKSEEKYRQEWVHGAIHSSAYSVESERNEIVFNQVQLRPEPSLCGEQGFWSGVYHISEPTPVYIAK